MTHSSKDIITSYLKDATEFFSINTVEKFTTQKIAEELSLSRSVISQYLNDLFKQGKLIKINSRPVYFLDRETIETNYHINITDLEYYDLEEFEEYLEKNGASYNEFSSLIGYDGSLSTLIKQAREIFSYPLMELMLVIYGEEGTGKRTLANLIVKSSEANYSSDSIHEVDLELIDQHEWSNLIKKTNTKEVWIVSHFELANEELQATLADIFNKTNIEKNYKQRFLFLCCKEPTTFIAPNLFRYIPIILKMPNFASKPIEEREAIIISLFKQESKKLNQPFSISSNVIRTFINLNRDNNINGINKDIQLTIAKALMNKNTSPNVVIHSYDMPLKELESITLSNNDLAYIDINHYVPVKAIDVYLDYFTMLLDCIDLNDMDTSMRSYNDAYNRMVDYLGRNTDISEESLAGIEVTIAYTIDTIVRKRFLNIPSNYIFIISKLIYITNSYSTSITKWQMSHQEKLSEILTYCHKNFATESIIVNEINDFILRNLEIKVADIVSLIKILILVRYNSELRKRKTFGLVICHGYSTASSMVQAVNTLIGNYVFESIDMPIDISVDKIMPSIIDKIQRINNFADVVLMVDMGSLEQIGNGIVSTINKNIGVVNNVTTKMVLEVGYDIVQGKNIQDILKHISSDFKVETKLIRAKENDKIIFTSESGIKTAQRMQELFIDALPTSIPVKCVTHDFTDLSTHGKDLELFKSSNVLFITGTANPSVPDVPFISLEGIITNNNIQVMNEKLSRYLDNQELKAFTANLIKSFTLENVVQYLTILNPQIVLDYVTVAVDLLQNKLSVQFSGKKLVGVYIHICCLIERLVTKTIIDDSNPEIEEFAKNNKNFIKQVNDSFNPILTHYNITIPNNEMLYLYQFVNSKEEASD